MKKQIVKEFITVKKVRYLPRKEPPAPLPLPQRILVVGRCLLDMITVCDEPPLPGKVQLTKEGFWRLGGHAPNICYVMRRLGTECEFLGRLSNSNAFENIATTFHGMRIDVSHCPRIPMQPAHQSIVIVRDRYTRTTIEYSKREHELSFQQFMGAVDYQRYSWIHFEARNFRETLRMILAVRDYNARNVEHTVAVSVDVVSFEQGNLRIAALADYALVHRHLRDTFGFMNGRETVWAVREAIDSEHKRWMSNEPKKVPNPNKEEMENKPKDCPAATSTAPIIIYDNFEEGASCLMPDDKYFKVDGHRPGKLVDNISEHDTFVGAFLYAKQEIKLSLRDALEYGTRATSLKVTQYGFDVLRSMPKDLISCYYA